MEIIIPKHLPRGFVESSVVNGNGVEIIIPQHDNPREFVKRG